MKADSRLDGPWEFPNPWPESAQGKRTDLTEAISTLKSRGYAAVAEEHPEAFVKYSKGFRALLNATPVERSTPPEVNLFYGPSGCGKSHLARYATSEDRWEDPIGSAQWFDGYFGQPKAIFDDFDGKMSHWRLKDWLRVTDCYALRVPVKGDFVYWAPSTIQVTTNYHPLQWWDWTERQQQYPALQRRFTRVYHWRTDSPRGWPIVIDRHGTPDLWDEWWKGPALTTTVHTPPQQLLGPLDDWIELPPALERSLGALYDFIDPLEQ